MPEQARLLAKSAPDVARPPTEATLPGHTARVVAAGRAILDAVGDHPLRAAHLGHAEWSERFLLSVLLACAWHDLGKANDHFQSMIRRARDGRVQAVRHEAISGLLLLEVPGLRAGLVNPALAS